MQSTKKAQMPEFSYIIHCPTKCALVSFNRKNLLFVPTSDKVFVGDDSWWATSLTAAPLSWSSWALNLAAAAPPLLPPHMQSRIPFRTEFVASESSAHPVFKLPTSNAFLIFVRTVSLFGLVQWVIKCNFQARHNLLHGYELTPQTSQ